MGANVSNPVPYTLPPTRLLRPIVICAIVMAFATNKSIISPGSLIYDRLLSQSPNALNATRWIQIGLFFFLYGAHAIECAAMAKKLHDNGVSLLSTDWCKWMLECFIGGKFCFEHFDGVVKGKTT